MIKKPTELNFTGKRLCMIIAGVPGIGKTTLALSAPSPLLIDLDRGVSRVEARYRKDVDEVNTYEELKEDLQNSDLSEYETIVIDTGGKLSELMKPYLIAKEVKNGQRDGSLSLKGFGALKREFRSFISFVKSLNKHLIIIFHATEVALANDVTGLRIRMEGGTKDEIWDDVDIGGFVEMVGKNRTISFSNCERFYAKGTHGVHGTYEIPVLEKGAKNDFVAKLFKSIQDDMNAEVEELKKYQGVMQEYIPRIAEAKDATELNNIFMDLAKATHYLTSKDELWFALNNKALELKLAYDKTAKQFK